MGEVGLYSVVFRLRGMKTVFNLGQIKKKIIYDPFIFAMALCVDLGPNVKIYSA